MSPKRLQLARDVKRYTSEIIRVCRRMKRSEPSGLERARLAQLAEYAELLRDTVDQSGQRAPVFAGKIPDE